MPPAARVTDMHTCPKDEAGQPVPGEAYRIVLPDGIAAEGTLDDKGLACVDAIDPGSCRITFPNLDQDTWESA